MIGKILDDRKRYRADLPYHNNVPKKIQFDSETTVFVSIVNINSKYSHDMSTEVLQDLSSFRREVKQ